VADISTIDPKKLSDAEYLELLQELTSTEKGLLDVDPTDFAKLVKRTSNDQFKTLEADPVSAKVADGIFKRMQERFKPENFKSSKTSTIRWVIGAKAGDRTYETTVSKQGCEVVEGAHVDDPRCTIKMGLPDFLKLASGNGNPPMMFMTRKLKIDGDVGFAASVTQVFDIPKA
jgi:putative sterol carrier protein